MQGELRALQPQLVRTVAEVEELMKTIAKEKAEVVEPKAAVVNVSARKHVLPPVSCTCLHMAYSATHIVIRADQSLGM
jgi:hypothetical protein